MSEISILVEELSKIMGDLGITPLYINEETVEGELLDPDTPLPDSKSTKKNQVAVLDKEEKPKKKKDDGDDFFDETGNQTRYTETFLQLIQKLIDLGTQWKNEKDKFEHSCKDDEQPSNESKSRLLEKISSFKDDLNSISDDFKRDAKKMTLLEQKIVYDFIEAFKVDLCVVFTALQNMSSEKNSDKKTNELVKTDTKDNEKTTGTSLVPTGSTEVTTKSNKETSKTQTGTSLMTLSSYKTAVSNSSKGFNDVLTIGYNVIKIGVKYIAWLTKSLLTAVKHTTMIGLYAVGDSLTYVWRMVMNAKVFLSDLLGDALQAIKKLMNNKVVKGAAGLLTGLAAFSPLGSLMIQHKDLMTSFISLPLDIVGIVPATVKGAVKAIKGIKGDPIEKAISDENKRFADEKKSIRNTKNKSQDWIDKEIEKETERHENILKAIKGKNGKYYSLNPKKNFGNLQKEVAKTISDVKNFPNSVPNIKKEVKTINNTQTVKNAKKQIKKINKEIQKTGRKTKNNIKKGIKNALAKALK